MSISPPAKWIDLSTNFVLSAGTVTVDPKAQKILILLNTPTQEYLLPKGRKDKGESLAEAALRETYEETGYTSSLLSHNLATKATTKSHDSAQPEQTLARSQAHKEPIACQQRITASGIRKIIFWYVGEADSTTDKVEGTQDVGEQFESHWVDIQMGLQMLTFDDDREIAAFAVEAFGRER